MALPFPSDDWVKALREQINISASYRQSARNWEGDFYFVIQAGEGLPADVYLYVDLWHGECRDAYQVSDPAARTPEFEIGAPLPIWRKVIEKKLDPIQGLITRQLKLKGNLVKIMRAPTAAAELVNCCTKVDTSWAA
jgi:putative sterol carrier protein